MIILQLLVIIITETNSRIMFSFGYFWSASAMEINVDTALIWFWFWLIGWLIYHWSTDCRLQLNPKLSVANSLDIGFESVVGCWTVSTIEILIWYCIDLIWWLIDCYWFILIMMLQWFWFIDSLLRRLDSWTVSVMENDLVLCSFDVDLWIVCRLIDLICRLR